MYIYLILDFNFSPTATLTSYSQPASWQDWFLWHLINETLLSESVPLKSPGEIKSILLALWEDCVLHLNYNCQIINDFTTFLNLTHEFLMSTENDAFLKKKVQMLGDKARIKRPKVTKNYYYHHYCYYNRVIRSEHFILKSELNKNISKKTNQLRYFPAGTTGMRHCSSLWLPCPPSCKVKFIRPQTKTNKSKHTGLSHGNYNECCSRA